MTEIRLKKDQLQILLDEKAQLEEQTRQLNIRRNELQRKINEERRKIAVEKQEQILREKEKKRKAKLQKIEEEIKNKELQLQEVARKIEEIQPLTWKNARNYQKSAIISAYHNLERGNSGFFNADDMGLGKTFQAASLIELYLAENPDKNILWLSKSSIVETGGTEREIRLWTEVPVVSILGKETKDQRSFKVELVDKYQKGTVLITNYEMMRTTPQLQNADFGMLVMDEVHKLKGGANANGPTGTWKAICQYLWGDWKEPTQDLNVDFILMLSGTPMVNRVAELWAFLHIFDPHRFDNLKSFERAFNAYVDYGGKVETGKILDMCLKDRMVRRTRFEVGLEIPELNSEEDQYRLVEYNPKQQEAYNQMRDRFFIWLDEQSGQALTTTAVISQLTRLRQISVWPVFSSTKVNPLTGREETISLNIQDSAKIDEAMDLIEEANDQVVVFCNFNEPFNEIKRRCTFLNLRCEFITGETKRYMGVFEVAFQNGEIDVLCINSSMGEGLNLQKNPERWKGGASVGIHLDRWWNKARDDQCDARIWRPGSNIPCFIYRIHAPHSVDDFVKALADEKADLFEGITEDKRLRPAFEWKEELKKVL